MRGAFSECHIPSTFIRYHRLIWMNDRADAVYISTDPHLLLMVTSALLKPSWLIRYARVEFGPTVCLLDPTKALSDDYKFFWLYRGQFMNAVVDEAHYNESFIELNTIVGITRSGHQCFSNGVTYCIPLEVLWSSAEGT